MKKIKKKEQHSGLDELIFTVRCDKSFVGRPDEKLTNNHGESYCDFCFQADHIDVKINLPRAMGYLTNLYPYRFFPSDSLQLEIVRQNILYTLDEIIGDTFTSQIRTAELSYLTLADSHDEISTLCDLFKESFSESKRQTKVFVNRNEDGNTIYTGFVSTALKNKLTIKIYDKGLQQGMDTPFLRIEFVLMSRYLNSFCKRNGLQADIETILTTDVLDLLYREFPACFEKYVWPGIIACLNSTVRKLSEKMIETHHITPVYAEMRNHVYCLEQVKRAMRMYAKNTGQSKGARDAAVFHIKRKYGLNDNIYDLLKAFRNYIKI